jgi:hypothetical protein
LTEYKDYRILPARNLIGYELQHIGRGSVAGALQGLFTSVKIAKDHIDSYLRGKEDNDVEDVSGGGSKQIQRRPYHRRKSPN